jgi:hypothetical protein
MHKYILRSIAPDHNSTSTAPTEQWFSAFCIMHPMGHSGRMLLIIRRDAHFNDVLIINGNS